MLSLIECGQSSIITDDKVCYRFVLREQHLVGPGGTALLPGSLEEEDSWPTAVREKVRTAFQVLCGGQPSSRTLFGRTAVRRCILHGISSYRKHTRDWKAFMSTCPTYSETLTESYFALLVWDKKAIEVQSFLELASKYSYVLKVTMSSAADVPYQMVQPTTEKRE